MVVEEEEEEEEEEEVAAPSEDSPGGGVAGVRRKCDTHLSTTTFPLPSSPLFTPLFSVARGRHIARRASAAMLPQSNISLIPPPPSPFSPGTPDT